MTRKVLRADRAFATCVGIAFIIIHQIAMEYVESYLAYAVGITSCLILGNQSFSDRNNVPNVTEPREEIHHKLLFL